MGAEGTVNVVECGYGCLPAFDGGGFHGVRGSLHREDGIAIEPKALLRVAEFDCGADQFPGESGATTTPTAGSLCFFGIRRSLFPKITARHPRSERLSGMGELLEKHMTTLCRFEADTPMRGVGDQGKGPVELSAEKWSVPTYRNFG